MAFAKINNVTKIFNRQVYCDFRQRKVVQKNFSVAKIDINEFLTRMREKGYFSLDDVETVFLEQNGDLSVLPKDKSVLQLG